MNSRSNSYSRLYMLTGKGGVGKTTVSLALTKALIKQGKRVRYLAFEESFQSNVLKDMQVDSEILDAIGCAQNYLGKKFKSLMVGSWIVRAPFFRAQLNMVPGFNYIIYLGHIMEQLVNDDDLILVLDAPSSGHFLTMFSAISNFKEIFGSGIIAGDIQKISDFMFQENVLKIIILSLAGQMSLHEAFELKDDLLKTSNVSSDIYVNNTLISLLKEIAADTLPDFLRKKIEIEREALLNCDYANENVFPRSCGMNHAAIVNDLYPYMDVCL